MSDVPALHAFGLDERANELAGTKPRSWSEFSARWADIIADRDGSLTHVTPRCIVADGVLVGSVNVFPQDGLDTLGYWLSHEHWGRGIASVAVGLLLAECATRPLHATTAAHNAASMRVLQKHGFVEVGRRMTPETERVRARETVRFLLTSAAKTLEREPP